MLLYCFLFLTANTIEDNIVTQLTNINIQLSRGFYKLIYKRQWKHK